MQPKTGLPKDCNINHNQSSNPQFLENLPHPKPYNGITKQSCPIELYSYPFDKHTCEVPFVFGKF